MRSVLTFLFIGIALSGLGHAETRVPHSPAEISLSFAPVVERAAPAVVNIYARRVVAARRSPFQDDPFFGPLFRDFGQAQPRLQNSLGSGVILSSDGVVVSNYHVVGEARDIRVVLNDRREFAADILLSDEESDLAILRLRDAEGLPTLNLRNSDDLAVGELVLAIGNPFGVGQTVTSGIVSGLARSGTATGSARGYFIQTDAAINPGNSGGALVDINGHLVGINTSILTRSGGSNGIGFAIPSNLVERFVSLAVAGATEFERPWAGIGGQAVTADLAETLGMAVPEGFLVSVVHPASPFANADIAVGDVILALDDVPVSAPQDMIFRLSVAGTYGEVTARVLRDGQMREITVRLTAPPDDPPSDPVTLPDRVALAGLTVANINPRILADWDLPLEAEGVVVLATGPYVGRVGLRPGDVIFAINGAEIRTTADVTRAASARVRSWNVDVLRNGRRLRLRFRA